MRFPPQDHAAKGHAHAVEEREVNSKARSRPRDVLLPQLAVLRFELLDRLVEATSSPSMSPPMARQKPTSCAWSISLPSQQARLRRHTR